MKVLIVGPAYPFRGGIANFNEALGEAFIQKNIEAEIVSFTRQYPNFLFPGSSQYDYQKAKPNIRITPLIHTYNPFTWFHVAKKICAMKPDLILARYWLPFLAPALGFILKRVKKKLNCPIIAITDNIIPHEKRPGDSFLTRYFIKACDGFVAMSDSVLKELSEFTSTPNKAFNPHPIYHIFGDKIERQEAIKKLNLAPEYDYALFFGFIRSYKGLDLLLKSFALIHKEIPKVKLLIAGEFYEDSKAYLDIIYENQLEEKVVLHNHYIPDENVKLYFSAANLVVQPYKTATQSGVTQIAYHFDRPMIVTNVGGLPEMVKNQICGFVVNPQPIEIASAIKEYFTKNLETEMSRNCNEEKARFAWSEMVETILKLSNAILTQKAPTNSTRS